MSILILNLFKILNHFYWTPTRLFRLKLRENADCWKCCSSEGTLIHLLWECPMIQSYWLEIHDRIENITQTNLDFCPKLYVLNDPQMTPNCGAADFIQTSIMYGVPNNPLGECMSITLACCILLMH
uniref:Reverse transcriptase zinc-binding domain-containing protein n=1 Tax=Esox lucius TaxID=8010 RepID=A0AAY5K5X7_ESOLU